jgi:hypothetical protein
VYYKSVLASANFANKYVSCGEKRRDEVASYASQEPRTRRGDYSSYSYIVASTRAGQPGHNQQLQLPLQPHASVLGGEREGALSLHLFV